MQRKLVQMGQHTLMSAIPSKWIDRHQLKKGNYIEFTEVENKLVITSTAEIYERKTEITLTSSTIMVVWRMIQPVYTLGYDEVKIHFPDQKALKYIENSMSGLIGWEIVETGRNFVIVKSISKHLDEEFDTILEKLRAELIVVADFELQPYLPAATSLAQDSKDWLYLACALKENTLIWSQDKGFKSQTRVPVKNTAELAQELGVH